MNLKHALYTIAILSTLIGGTAAAYEYKVVRVDLPNGSPVFALRRVDTPATLAMYSRDERPYRSIERTRTHERETVAQMQVGNSNPVTLRGRAH